MNDGFFWEDQKQLFSDEGELADYISDNCPEISRQDWPLTVSPAIPVYLKLNYKKQARHITEWLVEDYLNRLDSDSWHVNCSGQYIVESWLENYYTGCDWYDGPSKEAAVAIAQADKIMQEAISWWKLWNDGLLRSLSKYRWWNPLRWWIGITVIEQAVEKAEAALRGIDIYLAESSTTTKVDYPYSN